MHHGWCHFENARALPRCVYDCMRIEWGITKHFRAMDKETALHSGRKCGTDKTHPFNKKRPLLAPRFATVEGANRDDCWVMRARNPVGQIVHRVYAAAPAFFAMATI